MGSPLVSERRCIYSGELKTVSFFLLRFFRKHYHQVYLRLLDSTPSRCYRKVQSFPPDKTFWSKSLLFVSRAPLRIKADVVGGEETLLALVLTSPPVFVGELEVGDLGVFREADFCKGG
jgi:hypothetical protein